MKKLVSAILICILTILNTVPVIAMEEEIYANTKIKLEFAQNFNVNESEIGDTINFRLKEDICENGNIVLPENSIFIATVTDKDKSKFGYRRAVAHIKFSQIVLPDGRTYYIMLNPQKDELKSAETLNLLKATVSTAACAGVCLIGATVVAVEALSVAGILFLPYVGIAVGGAVAVTGKGLNYKAHKGTPITITLKSPINLEFRDIEQIQEF